MRDRGSIWSEALWDRAVCTASTRSPCSAQQSSWRSPWQSQRAKGSWRSYDISRAPCITSTTSPCSARVLEDWSSWKAWRLKISKALEVLQILKALKVVQNLKVLKMTSVEPNTKHWPYVWRSPFHLHTFFMLIISHMSKPAIVEESFCDFEKIYVWWKNVMFLWEKK